MTDKPTRPSMSKARRLRLWDRDKGVCYLCEAKVKHGEEWEIEHIIPWTLSFDDSDRNLKVAHKDCHRVLKTGGDVARIAKAKAQGGETGQQARRARRDRPLIPSRPFAKDQNKKPWPKRKFERRIKE